MPEKNSFPQIPSTVWWGVRSILQKSPNTTIDERMLGVQLSVQLTAAKQYLIELRRIGIINDEGRTTSLAQKWRLDASYGEAVQEIISSSYPQSLIDVAPPGEAERSKVVDWFLREGLGTGAAKNKAATYLMIGSADPNDAPGRTAARASRSVDASSINPERRIRSNSRRESSSESSRNEASGTQSSERGKSTSDNGRAVDGFPLNINLQIHIGADAGKEQIEYIFSAMKRYLYDAPDN